MIMSLGGKESEYTIRFALLTTSSKIFPASNWVVLVSPEWGDFCGGTLSESNNLTHKVTA
jgi:hypothetical protein